MQYLQQSNEKVISKLNSQIDFINKENHRLQTQLDLFLRDKTVVDHIERYRKDVDDLTFENHTLRKDLRELATTLKDYQELEFKSRHMERALTETQLTSELEVKENQMKVNLARQEVDLEKRKTESLRAAFNADRKALSEKIEALEDTLAFKRKEFEELSSQLSTREETDSMQRNELNFWNGKVTNMRRDLEMQ